jgi:G:T-mismatch repair DNA endonuclease (very short patch repair protein)
MPSTRVDYWTAKFKKNAERDRRNQRELRRLGWKVIVVWECQLRDIGRLTERLNQALGPLYEGDFPEFKVAAESKGTYGNDDDGDKSGKS